MELLNQKKLLSKEEVLLHSLYEFYYENNQIVKMLPVVTGNSPISLRVLDWFVTNYSKKFDIIYPLKFNSKCINFNVHQDYKNKLKSYNKRFFDPFCRINKKNLKNKIAFKYNKNKCILTTIGQLNFFRWTIRYNILDFVEENLDKINEDMNNKSKIKTKKKIKVNKRVQRINLNTLVDFNLNPHSNKKKI